MNRFIATLVQGAVFLLCLTSKTAAAEDLCSTAWSTYVEDVISIRNSADHYRVEVILFSEPGGKLHDCLGINISGTDLRTLQHGVVQADILDRVVGKPEFEAETTCGSFGMMNELFSRRVYVLRLPKDTQVLLGRQCEQFRQVTLPQSMALYFSFEAD